MSKDSALDGAKLQSLDAPDFLSWNFQVQLGMKEPEFFYTVQRVYTSTVEDRHLAGKSVKQVFQSSRAVNFVSRPSKHSRKLPAPKSDTPTHWGYCVADCRVPKKQKEEAPHNVVNMMVDNYDPKSSVAMIGSSRHGASSEWWLDSGATCHVTNDRGLLTEIRAVRDKVENCNGGETDVTHAGTAKLVLSSGAAADGGEYVAWNPDEDDLLSDY